MKTKKSIFLVVSLFVNALVFAQVQGPVSANGLLKVNGNKIENKNGTPYSVAGNSIFWSSFINDGGKFYADGVAKQVVDHLAVEWKSGIIRAAMGLDEADGLNIQNTSPNFRNQLVANPNGEGYFNNPEKEYAKIKRIIDAAIANDIYVIVDFHSHFAHLFEEEAIKFFTDIATEYGSNEHIIYEIYNEPIGDATDKSQASVNAAFQGDTPTRTWNNIIRPYAINVIKAIRAIDPDNMIIVGTPAFAQFVDVASQNPITRTDLNLNQNQELNLAYTLHFYAGTHRENLRNRARTALSNGIALFVTEWGTVEASGAGNLDLANTMTWLNFMEDNGISHANWSVSDKGGDTSSIILGGRGVTGLLENVLTPSGKLIRCVIENWNAGTDYTSCTTESGDGPTTPPTPTVNFPKGVGIQLNNSNNFDGKSDAVTDEFFNGSTIRVFSNIKSGAFVSYSLRAFTNFDVNKSYTIQFVVSSESAGNTFRMATNQFGSGNIRKVYIENIAVPNTGKNNFAIATASGVRFEKSSNGDLPFAIETVNAVGNGFSIESIWVTEDNDPALSIPTFSAEIANQINIYPVPATSFLTIDTPSIAKKVAYALFDIKGNRILEKTELINNSVAIGNLASGIYLIQLYIKGQTQVYKFIKS